MKEEKIVELAEKNYEKFQDLLDNLADGYKITGQFKYFFPNDLVDLMNFYLIVSNKEWENAYNNLEKMDTDIREKTSLSIYDFLAEKCENLRFTEKLNKK